MDKFGVDSEIIERFRYAFEQARNDRERYLDKIRGHINELIGKISQFDKIYILGGLGAKLLKSATTILSQSKKPKDIKIGETVSNDHDEHLEVALEYILSIATATPNLNKGIIPTQEDIDHIYNLSKRIHLNVCFFELFSDVPTSGNIFDHRLRTMVMLNTLNIRGHGYRLHINEVFLESLSLHDIFLKQFYRFDSNQLLDTLNTMEIMICSKISNNLGMILSHRRFVDWSNRKGDDQIAELVEKTGKHFMELFVEDNPDLNLQDGVNKLILYNLDDINSYRAIFRVFPRTDIEKKIFDVLAVEFGSNECFYQPDKFKAFPLNDSLIPIKPLIRYDECYYYFSPNIASRNLLKIGASLIENADPVYYQNCFRGNTYSNSRDNYLENKTKSLFKKLLPNVRFYSSLKYQVIEENQTKDTELDLLGVGQDSIYIIEVKAGELSTKHRRGALKGLKDRLGETIDEGSYQCHRALKYIMNNKVPEFKYIEHGKSCVLVIDKSTISNYLKISVMREHLGVISANLSHLIKSGVLSQSYKWSWIISIFDLMVFSDLIDSENDFKDYLANRIYLYEQENVICVDEIDILGCFLEDMLPLSSEEDELNVIQGFTKGIDEYYTNKLFGGDDITKPCRKHRKKDD